MAFTGKDRSLTVIIDKTIAGVRQEGYPKTYQGRNEFAHNGANYPAIDELRMMTMPIVQYQNRLTAFKSWVESLEVGLNFNTDTLSGHEAYRENTVDCPIGH